MKDRVRYLNELIHSSIPITQSMGIEVTDYTGDKIVFSAPLDKNRNDKGTAFAGSLYSLLVLTGWGFVTLGLEDEGVDARVVIHKGEITYFKPVREHNFEACCRRPGAGAWDQFKNNLINESKGKIGLIIEIAAFGEIMVRFDAVYYGLKND